MKILYLHQFFSTPIGTCGTRSYEFATRLTSKGHTVDMVTSSAYLPKAWKLKKGWQTRHVDGIILHIYHLDYSNEDSFNKRIIKFIKFSVACFFKSRKISCDVVFATSTPLTIGIPGVFSARKHKVPLVFEVRDLWPELPIAMGVIKNPVVIKLLKIFESWIYRNSAKVVALSPGMAEGVLSTGYKKENISIIPNACDISLFQKEDNDHTSFRNRYDWLKQNPMLLYAGTLGVINGVSYLVDIAHSLLYINPEVRVVVIGSGMERDSIIKQAKEKKVWKVNFFLLEAMPKNELAAAFSAANISTSLFIPVKEMWNNSANKFFDTLASGTPVAINYLGWQADIINDSGVGLILPPSDALLSAKKINQAITNKEWLRSSGCSARKIALRDFDRDKLAQRFEKVIVESIND
jgi:glycosyltransferase involved in cell wall biosynthesis